MKSTLQLELVVPGTRTQGLTVAVDPDGWLVKLKSTVPVGGGLVPLAGSLTVAGEPSEIGRGGGRGRGEISGGGGLFKKKSGGAAAGGVVVAAARTDVVDSLRG